MIVLYRISEESAGYKKDKPPYINNINCLKNCVAAFHEKIIVFGDNLTDSSKDSIMNILRSSDELIHINKGSGAQSFQHVLRYSLGHFDNDETVYFLESDYIHREGLDFTAIIESGFKLGADYVSLYDHPDKYIDGDKGGNPQVEEGGEVTRVLCGDYSHWKLTNSTTMTFAAKVRTLREDEGIFLKYTMGTYPRDYEMFLELREKGRALITPLPAYATHGESKWLSPFKDWELEFNKSIKYYEEVYG